MAEDRRSKGRRDSAAPPVERERPESAALPEEREPPGSPALPEEREPPGSASPRAKGAGERAQIFQLGMAKRRSVLGDAHVDRAEANKSDFDADFQEFITRYAWGEVWQREGLDERTRHLIVLAMMAALGREEEFAMHVRASRNTGVTPGELKEALHLVAIYAGLPLANGAFRTARQILAEAEEQ